MIHKDKEYLSYQEWDEHGGIVYDYAESARRGKDTWRVQKAFYYKVPGRDNWFVFVDEGYYTDGATSPRVLWFIIPRWGAYGKAVIVHDKLCDTKVVHISGSAVTIENKLIDDIFDSALFDCKVEESRKRRYKLVRKLMVAGVRFWDMIGMR